MEIFKIIKLSIFLVILLVIMVPLWYSYLDHSHIYCTVEDFNSNKNKVSNHITITGNALFQYACRYEELSHDTLYNVSYYIPLVDSLWSIDKPVKTVLQFESGKMAFEAGFTEAVAKLDGKIDSLSKLRSNRMTFTGDNKLLEFPRIETEAKSFFQDKFNLKIPSRFTVSKIIINKHFSMEGMIFGTAFTCVIGFLFYYFTKPMFKKRIKVIEEYKNK